MGSRLFDEIREKRGLCYSVYAIDHAFADVPILQLGSGLDSAKCDRGLHAHARDRRRAARRRPDRGGGRSGRAPTPPGGSCSPSRTRRRRPPRRQPADRLRRVDRPRRGDRRARRRHLRRGARGRRGRRGPARGRPASGRTRPRSSSARRAVHACSPERAARARRPARRVVADHLRIQRASSGCPPFRASTIASMSTQSLVRSNIALKTARAVHPRTGIVRPSNGTSPHVALDLVVERQHAEEQIDRRLRPDMSLTWPSRSALSTSCRTDHDAGRQRRQHSRARSASTNTFTSRSRVPRGSSVQ